MRHPKIKVILEQQRDNLLRFVKIFKLRLINLIKLSKLTVIKTNIELPTYF